MDRNWKRQGCKAWKWVGRLESCKAARAGGLEVGGLESWRAGRLEGWKAGGLEFNLPAFLFCIGLYERL